VGLAAWILRRGALFVQMLSSQRHCCLCCCCSLPSSLQDSLVGLAAWIPEKIRTWSDCGDTGQSSCASLLLLLLLLGLH
jgi:hypothetical protein